MMNNLYDHESLPPEECVFGICGCGRPLYPDMKDGVRIGVTHHGAEDTDWHDEYFGGLRVRLMEMTDGN